jgi:hypothetical protein
VPTRSTSERVHRCSCANPECVHRCTHSTPECVHYCTRSTPECVHYCTRLTSECVHHCTRSTPECVQYCTRSTSECVQYCTRSTPECVHHCTCSTSECAHPLISFRMLPHTLQNCRPNPDYAPLAMSYAIMLRDAFKITTDARSMTCIASLSATPQPYPELPCVLQMPSLATCRCLFLGYKEALESGRP